MPLALRSRLAVHSLLGQHVATGSIRNPLRARHHRVHVTDVSERGGEPFRPRHLGWGLAVGDLDYDGRIDAIVLGQNEPLVEVGRFRGAAVGCFEVDRHRFLDRQW
jgi:hypothetical protein